MIDDQAVICVDYKFRLRTICCAPLLAAFEKRLEGLALSQLAFTPGEVIHRRFKRPGIADKSELEIPVVEQRKGKAAANLCGRQMFIFYTINPPIMGIGRQRIPHRRPCHLVHVNEDELAAVRYQHLLSAGQAASCDDSRRKRPTTLSGLSRNHWLVKGFGL